jgi:RHS repeat-associated protein
VQGFLYQDGLKPTVELDGSNNVISRFVYSTGINVPAYMIKAGVAYKIVTDHLGSPRLVIDAVTGSVAQRLDYDEFGKVTLDTNPGFQPFGFAGGLYDAQTGLVHYGAREYEPDTGRWTAKDPVGFASGPNLYIYADNDPVNLIDPLGTETEKERKVRETREAVERMQAARRAREAAVQARTGVPPRPVGGIGTSNPNIPRVSPGDLHDAVCPEPRSRNRQRGSFTPGALGTGFVVIEIATFSFRVGWFIGSGINQSLGLSDKMSDQGARLKRWAESEGASSNEAWVFGAVATFSPGLWFID